MKNLLLILAFITMALSINAQDTLNINCIKKFKNNADTAFTSGYVITILNDTVSFTSVGNETPMRVTVTDTLKTVVDGTSLIYNFATDIDGYQMSVLYENDVLTIVGLVRFDGSELYYVYDPKYAVLDK